jgi:5-methyltetrahydropteroyltriglutamate--homocysteine methyltransferase
MAEEYEIVADTGMTIQIDAPELLTAGHTAAFADAPLEEVKDVTRLHVEALNEALANVPTEQVRLHTCWGATRAPTTSIRASSRCCRLSTRPTSRG